MAIGAADLLNTEGTEQLHTSKPCTNTFPKLLPVYYRKVLFGLPRHRHVHEHAVAQKAQLPRDASQRVRVEGGQSGWCDTQNIEMVSKFARSISIKKSLRGEA